MLNSLGEFDFGASLQWHSELGFWMQSVQKRNLVEQKEQLKPAIQLFYTRHTDTGTRCVTLYGTGMMWVWVLRQQYCPKTAISLEYHIIIWVAGGCSFFYEMHFKQVHIIMSNFKTMKVLNVAKCKKYIRTNEK